MWVELAISHRNTVPKKYVEHGKKYATYLQLSITQGMQSQWARN